MNQFAEDVNFPLMFGPNISGEFGYQRGDGDEYTAESGAFRLKSFGSGATGISVIDGKGWTFDASRSSGRYGDSSTVQPASIRSLPLIKF